MFGFTLQKLLFTALIIVLVWQAFKWLGRRGEMQKRRADADKREAETKARTAHVEDMVECPDCGAYVPKGGGHRCG